MNAFTWKKITVLKHTWRKGLLLILFPVALTVFFCLIGIPLTNAILYATIIGVLLSNIIFWDLDDILNYETTAIQPVSRMSLVLHYFAIPGFVIYILDICLAVLTAMFFSSPFRIQCPGIIQVILGGLFSVSAFIASNAQVVNYHKFIQYASLPFGICGILFPVLIYCYPAFFMAHFTIIQIIGTAYAIVLIITLLLLHNNEKSVTTISRILTGYGDMND